MKSQLLLVAVLATTSGVASAQTFERGVAPLLERSCLGCHDGETGTPLDLEGAGFDLSDPDAFRVWEKVFDRVSKGEMPPASEPRPERKHVETALAALKTDLLAASRRRQKEVGRVPARRLTKRELDYTLRDLLGIDGDVTRDLPGEVESESFDTVGARQRISGVHVEGYLQAADEALKRALNLGSNPYRSTENDLDWLDEWHEKPLLDGGSITRRLKYGDGVVLFADVAYLTQFQFRVTMPGVHRIEARVAAYQSKDPLTAKFVVKSPSGEARVAKAVDLEPGQPRVVRVETFLDRGDTPYLTFDVGTMRSGGAPVYRAGGAKHYRGPGLAILSQRVEGPLFPSWPSPGTQALLGELALVEEEGGSYSVTPPADPLGRVAESVRRFAPRAFRRPVSPEELQALLKVAEPAIRDGRGVEDALRLTLRSVLSSPQFLLFDGEPGELDGHALASRLSYFLWKSLPDDELTTLAGEGRLTDSDVLAAQVERMLDDDRSARFVNDFVGQWLRVEHMDATTPDDGLYPEFDELLAEAIPKETELFFGELVDRNLSATLLVDSDFTMLNRRLAEHYGIDGVEGQHFRRVRLPAGSPRGGVLTQAAILKTTANGTTTSPVLRGNFVLANFLGTPPSPPPPDVGSVEPDTRGQTTIRELLRAHRDVETCNQCHRKIDPPGFALESFDPVGGFRTHYRIDGGEQEFGDFTVKLPPRKGGQVDASGVMEDGTPFGDVKEFKALLMAEKEQVARNLVSQLVVYATGGEIQFADREEIERIVKNTSPTDYRVRDLIHEVVQSRLFRHQ